MKTKLVYRMLLMLPPNGDDLLKAVIFDMDGVLVDSMSYHAQAVNNIFDQIGVEMDQQDIFEREGERTADIIKYLLKKATGDTSAFDIKDIVSRYIAEFNRIVELRTFDGMQECLEDMKTKFRFSVVSGSNRPIVNDIIQSQFPGIFDVIISADDVEKGKPAPDPYLMAMEKLGVEKDECIVVENAPMGVRSARSAGICCIAVPTYLPPEKLKMADMVIKDHIHLVRYLSELKPTYNSCLHSSKS
ncbi:HAD family phosphatase [Methanolobus sp. ZRKC3]|uniref:HAD family hydrolase n=1 Tax=Methanolobus sp. ZRKC3 TaxID=3125786 RepID=UPI003246F47A